ncbi:hypothetical protein [Idiomarina abyssalis]|uniref:hypothetical protein n=1 Tax=Idiomarina abyssalis TaxID=86102 RepID=UPI003A91487E
MLSAINESLTEAILSEEKATVEMTVEVSVKKPDQILATLAVSPELTLADVAKRIGKSLRAVERAASKLKTRP